MKNALISALSVLGSKGSGRYVRSFSRAPLDLSGGHDKPRNEHEEVVLAQFQECGQLFADAVAHYPALKGLEETIFVKVVDLDDLRMSATLKDGQATISQGWDNGKRPTLIVPLYAVNIAHFREILASPTISHEQLYRIARVLFSAFIKGLYDAAYLYEPGDKRYLKLDNIFHVEMSEMPNVTVDGFPGSARVTVVNVNGEWLVFDGFQGTPRVRVTCTLDQALEYYQILMIEMKRAKNVGELQKAYERYMTLRDKTVTELIK